MMYLLTEIEPYLWVSDQAKFLSDLYEWPTNTDNSALTILSSNIKLINSWLEEFEFIAGTEFTAADILAYHLLSWCTLYNLDLSEIVTNYMKRLENRVAFPYTMKNPGSPAKTG